MKLLCKRTCQYAKSIYKVGDIIDVDTIVKCPKCNGTGEISGRPCQKCRETGRSDPPHHFELMDTKEKPVKIVDAEGSVRDESNEIDVLRKEFEKNGIGFDRRWGLRTLQDEYKKAEKEGKISGKSGTDS
jgi:hypothetical protein